MSMYKRIGNTHLRTASSWIAAQLLSIANCKNESPCGCLDNHVETCSNYDRANWAQKHTDLLEAFMKQTAPNGSGFDAGTTIDLNKSTPEKLVFNTSFHHMDEQGGYTIWTEHTVTVKASLFFGVVVRVSGRDKDDIKDYIRDEFTYWLNTYFTHTVDEIDERDIFLSEYRVQQQQEKAVNHTN